MGNPRQRGVLEIVVVHVDRRPVAGIRIRGIEATPASAEPGRFVVADVSPGRVEIVVEADRMATDHGWVGVVPGRN